MCKPFLLLAMLSMLLASCGQQDKNEAKRKIENAKKELRHDLHKAGQEIKKDSHEVAAELRSDAHKAKKEIHKKSDDPSGSAKEQ
jgi:F0F1-type ATP synthase membrane subunit b/b'